MIVEAHFDESGTDAREITLAGYLFESDRVAEFSSKWEAVLAEYKLPFLHMRDFAPGVNEYAHLDGVTRGAIQTSLMRILRRYAVNGIVVNMENALTARKRSYFRACERAARNVITWAENVSFDGNIAYFFERGAAGQGLLDVFFTRLNDRQKDKFRYVSHSFVDKKGNPTVQAADLLAWLYQNYTKKRRKEDLARLDLRYLLRTPHIIQDDLGDPPRESRCESVAQSRVRQETVYYLPQSLPDGEGFNLVLKADIKAFQGRTKGTVLACPVCRRALGEDMAPSDFWMPNNITKSARVRCWCGTWSEIPKTLVPFVG